MTSSSTWLSILYLKRTLSSLQRCSTPDLTSPLLQHASSHRPAPHQALISSLPFSLSDKSGCSPPGKICPTEPAGSWSKVLALSVDFPNKDTSLETWGGLRTAGWLLLHSPPCSPDSCQKCALGTVAGDLNNTNFLNHFSGSDGRKINCIYLKCTIQ